MIIQNAIRIKTVSSVYQPQKFLSLCFPIHGQMWKKKCPKPSLQAFTPPLPPYGLCPYGNNTFQKLIYIGRLFRFEHAIIPTTHHHWGYHSNKEEESAAEGQTLVYNSAPSPLLLHTFHFPVTLCTL